MSSSTSLILAAALTTGELVTNMESIGIMTMSEISINDVLIAALGVGQELFIVREPHASRLRDKVEQLDLGDSDALAIDELAILVQSLELLLDRKGLEPSPFPNHEALSPNDCFEIELLNEMSSRLVSCVLSSGHSEVIAGSVSNDGEESFLFKFNAEIDTALYCNGSSGIAQVYVKPSSGLVEICLYLDDDDGESELGCFQCSPLGIEDCLLQMFQNQNSLTAIDFLSELGFEFEDQ